jgi:hypothetical protein
LSEFNVNDRVKAVYRIDERIRKGLKGTIVRITDNSMGIGVKWDEHVSGHDCDTGQDFGRCWWVYPFNIRLDTTDSEEQEEEEEEEEVDTCDSCGYPEYDCQCCENCGSYNCECCSTCMCYPCECCESCGTSPCECCGNCGYSQYDCECERCEACNETIENCMCENPPYQSGGSDSDYDKFYPYPTYKHIVVNGSQIPVLEEPVKTSTEISDRLGLKPMIWEHEVADFYLLLDLKRREHLEDNAWLGIAFEQKKDFLLSQLEPYTRMVIGGEIRHALTRSGPGKSRIEFHLTEIHGANCQPFIDWLESLNGKKRYQAWESWIEFHAKYKPDCTAWVRDVYNMTWPGGGMGGKSWGRIADTLWLYETGQLDEVLFIDQCFSLQHNGGFYLNKVWAVPHTCIFEYQHRSDMGALRLLASDYIRNLYDALDKIVPQEEVVAAARVSKFLARDQEHRTFYGRSGD